ncbi:telomerase-binding protein EST1A [Ceratitis capitata]|uniref:(Mediterranean fruit fly) hypothetical protein n=1 Tax=Ceratitis capitata TaxID=7213 RepID=W8AWH3_CERCA|nr:telomerase-binding protein EST1A [Ceratitis capitata]CAD6992737.1 unnamed protein product [Ceratitis capitata]
MNQKGAREQNETSIIRNLPKRLQKRIVEDVGENTLVTVVEDNRHNCSAQPSTSNGGVNVYVNKYDGYDKVPTRLLQKEDASRRANQKENGATEVTRINFFLKNAPNDSALNKNNTKKVTEPVLETSGKSVVNNGVSMKGGHSGLSNASIPGILRLNESKQVVDMEKNNLNEKNLMKNSGRRPAARNKRVTQDNPSTKSPSRQLQRQSKQPLWFEMLADIPYAQSLSKYYEKITSMMHYNVVVEQWCQFAEARNELQTIFAKLLLQQLKLCCEQKIDTFFWKLLYYNVREYFTKNNNSKSNTNEMHNKLLIIIDEGLEFYTDLHTKLSAKYINPYQQASNISSSEKLPEPRSTHKFEFIAKVAAQKLLICLGDLCRYKTKELQSNDYTDAAKYYQQAQVLIPTNGIPYNQLAIVSIHARKKFDAVYYHMRSLLSSNAIYSARESLLVLFDEIRKKYEENELKASPLHQSSPRCNNTRASKSMRKEVWIHVDGVRRLHRTSESDSGRSKRAILKEEQGFKQLNDEELIRRFTSLYLYIIGKLYTGIGMESVVAHQRKLLAELSVLLSRSPFPIKRSRLLKIVALNIFILEHNMHKESRREIRYYAFNFCNQIFGLLLRKCNQLFETFEDKLLDHEDLSFIELNTLLQYINIYTDWLTRNVAIWEPVRNEEHIIMNSWAEWESFYQVLKRLIDDKSINNVPIDSLDEEVYLSGFTPLMPSTNNSNACKCLPVKSICSESEQFFARLQKIQNFQENYESNQANLHTHEDSFTIEELNGAMENVLSSWQSDEDDNSENIVVNGANSERFIKDANATDGVEDAQISQLSKRRKELEARTNVKKMYNAKLEEILKFLDTKVYIEVRPKYLMPDTNCFIDCLDDFVNLINEHKRYILVIPLTVVKELDGLYKGVKVESYQDSTQKNRIHHYDDVSTCAKRSLDFIMSAKNNVKCATTKGSFINASLFALAEEEFMSNDDKILSTALSLSKTMSTETNSDGKYFIQTELVLITTDRNLRVKALARNLAVSEMAEFLQWVKDCNT